MDRRRIPQAPLEPGATPGLRPTGAKSRRRRGRQTSASARRARSSRRCEQSARQGGRLQPLQLVHDRLPEPIDNQQPVEIAIGCAVVDGSVQARFGALPAHVAWPQSRDLTRAEGRRNLLFMSPTPNLFPSGTGNHETKEVTVNVNGDNLWDFWYWLPVGGQATNFIWHNCVQSQQYP